MDKFIDSGTQLVCRKMKLSIMQIHFKVTHNMTYGFCNSIVIFFFQTKIFRKLEDIPKEVITKHFKLLGKVTGIGEFGVLQIQHIPILEMKIPLISKKQKGKEFLQIVFCSTSTLKLFTYLSPDSSNILTIINRRAPDKKW